MTDAPRLLAGPGRALGRTAGLVTGLVDTGTARLRSLPSESARRTARGRGTLRTAVGSGADRLRTSVREARGRTHRDPEARDGGRQLPAGVVVQQSADVAASAVDAYEGWLRHAGRRGHRITGRTIGERVTWSDDARGVTRAVTTFHALSGGLTRVLLTVQHRTPGGLGRGLRGALRGRRVRLDLREYACGLALPGPGRAHADGPGDPDGGSDNSPPTDTADTDTDTEPDAVDDTRDGSSEDGDTPRS